MSAHSTATRTRSWPETAPLAQAWRRPAATDEPERLTSWQALMSVAIWTIILYGFLDAGWAIAATLATGMVVFAMQRRPA